MLFFYLLVDPFVSYVDVPCVCSLEGVEYGQPGVLAVRVNEQRCSLWVSGFSVDLYHLL